MVATAAAVRRHGTILARCVALAVVVLATAALVIGHLQERDADIDTPSSETTVTSESGSGTVHVDEEKTGHEAGSTDTTTTTTTPRTTQTTTVRNSDTTPFGWAMRNPASYWLFEGLLVVLLAFLAGAAAQRIYVGHYGVKVGSLELTGLPEITEAEAASAKAAIEVGDIPDVFAERRFHYLSLQVHPWWVESPAATEPAGELLGYQRLRLQAIVRSLAPATTDSAVSYADVVKSMIENKSVLAGFAAGLVTLDELAERVVAGAPISAAVAIQLNAAFERAAKRLLKISN